MRFVDWKLYVSVALGIISGAAVPALHQGNPAVWVVAVTLTVFAVVYLVLLLTEFAWEQVRSRA